MTNYAGVAPDTFLHTNKGLLSAKSLVDSDIENIKVPTLLGRPKFLQCAEPSINRTMTVTTNYNHITLSSSSKLLVISPDMRIDWVPVSELQYGQYVALTCDNGLGAPSGQLIPKDLEGLPLRMGKDYSILLGYIVNSYLEAVVTDTLDTETFKIHGASDISGLIYRACPKVPYTIYPSERGEDVVLVDPKYTHYFLSLFGIKRLGDAPSELPQILMQASRSEVAAFLSVLFIKTSISVSAGPNIRYDADPNFINCLRQVLWSYFNILTTVTGNSMYITGSSLQTLASRVKFRSKNKNMALNTILLDRRFPPRIKYIPYIEETPLGLTPYREGSSIRGKCEEREASLICNQLTDLKGRGIELAIEGINLIKAYANSYCWQRVEQVSVHDDDTTISISVHSAFAYSANGFITSTSTNG